MTPPPRRSLFDRAFGRTRRLAARKRANGLRPWAEGLEDRVVLSTIMWNTAAAPTGGDWDVGGNWVGGVAPNSMQNAVIDLTTAGTITHMQNDADSVLTLTTTNATIDMTAGSIAFGTGTSSIGSVTIGAGSSDERGTRGKRPTSGRSGADGQWSDEFQHWRHDDVDGVLQHGADHC